MINIHMRSFEFENKATTPQKPMTPAQARIESLKTQKRNVDKQLKAERDRQQIAKSQHQIGLLMTPGHKNT